MTIDKLPDRPVDKQGRALRDRKARNFGSAPFMGGEGKEHPRTPKLRARQAGYDNLRKQEGRKRPGSLKQ